MSNVIQFRPSSATTSTAGVSAPGVIAAVLPFPSIADCEGRAIDEAAAEGDLETMMRMAVNGRSAEARSRASVWLEDIFNVRVV